MTPIDTLSWSSRRRGRAFWSDHGGVSCGTGRRLSPAPVESGVERPLILNCSAPRDLPTLGCASPSSVVPARRKGIIGPCRFRSRRPPISKSGTDARGTRRIAWLRSSSATSLRNGTSVARPRNGGRNFFAGSPAPRSPNGTCPTDTSSSSSTSSSCRRCSRASRRSGPTLPSYGPAHLVLVELKTEPGSHRVGQLRYYHELAAAHHPDRRRTLVYVTRELSDRSVPDLVPLVHVHW